MKNGLKITFLLLFLLTFTFSLFSCGGEGEDNRTNPCSECDSGEYAETVRVKATTFSDGVRDFTCPDCGHSKSETIPATGKFSVLYVGDYSAVDSMAYVDGILSDMGCTDLTVGLLCYNISGGVSIEDHSANIKENKGVYSLTLRENGRVDMSYSLTFAEGIGAVEWDKVILHQRIPDAGDGESYGELRGVVDAVRSNLKSEDADILFNMLWAYGKGDSSPEFDAYGGDQMQMYSEIVGATRDQVSVCEGIDSVIPSGTSVQNVRATYLGDAAAGNGIRLDLAYGKAIAAITLCSALLDIPADELDLSSLEKLLTAEVISEFDIITKAVKEAMNTPYEITRPDYKSLKLLIFGNSYGNDATGYLEEMLREGGYREVIIGHAGESSMLISDHCNNIDDDPSNDYVYNGKPFSVHYKTVNGKKVVLPADYKEIIADEPWDYVAFYQAPTGAAALGEIEYYERTSEFVTALRANMTNPDGKIIYYMTWAHNVSNTAELYSKIRDVTRDKVAQTDGIDGVIPAATLIQNLRTSYLKDGSGGDITRDWGHLNYGVGRYAMALLFYCYLGGGEVTDISIMPRLADAFESIKNAVSEGKGSFTDVDEENLPLIREAVISALEKPYEITESSYKEKP